MRKQSYKRIAICFILTMLILAFAGSALIAATKWLSNNHYRMLVRPGGTIVKNSPVSVDLYFADIIAAYGGTGTFDENTIEVVGYDSSGNPKVYNTSRVGYEQYLLPWRVDKYYGISKVTLTIVMPDPTYTQYAIYFDTLESGLGRPDRYPGLVGNGDWFMEGYGKRELNACGYDDWCDFDGDGDLDIIKGGTEPYLYFYENVGGHKPYEQGGNRYVNRGKLTSNGSELVLKMDGSNRSWVSATFYDWDDDGDKDLFAYIVAGPTAAENEKVWIYENITGDDGSNTLRFQIVKYLQYEDETPVNSPITFLDWDGDGQMEICTGGAILAVSESVGPAKSLEFMELSTGVCPLANGVPITILSPRPDMADIDGDDKPDLFVAGEEGRVYFFKNVGTKQSPKFSQGRIIVHHEFMDLRARVKVFDFDGDGLKDFVVGRYWERSQWGGEPRVYGRLYKNIGTLTAPKFQAVGYEGGAPYTERFQICDAVRQNSVRAVDWNSDGKFDLIAGDTDGYVWYFRNTSNNLQFSVFAPGERLKVRGEMPIRVYGEETEMRAAGYARPDVTDWDSDGRKDLLVADGRGWLYLYMNEGTQTDPVLGPGSRVYANNKMIDGTSRSSVLVCDWNNDGKKDVVFGMVGRNEDEPFALTESFYYDWPRQNLRLENGSIDPDWDKERGFLVYLNTAPTANEPPILGYPEWIKSGSSNTIISYQRPNLGSFVSWNSEDTKKDFIGCEFEGNIRFYKNMGTGNPGSLPVFSDSAEGVKIVEPYTKTQMISGADAIDFNNDGDIDILTGQGHGGSGLRYYERDYINNLFRYVIVDLNEWALEIPNVKRLADSPTFKIVIPQVIVTATFTDFFYVETPNRESGIRVNWSGTMPTIGQKVDVAGTLTTINGERCLSANSVTVNGSGTITPIAMSNKSVGGGAFQFTGTAGIGQRGISGATGLNNIGILIKTSGTCTLNLAPAGDYYDSNYIFIDDGSGTVSQYLAKDGTYKSVSGIKVEINSSTIAIGNYVVATGISSIELINETYQKRVLPRSISSDIVTVPITP